MAQTPLAPQAPQAPKAAQQGYFLHWQELDLGVAAARTVCNRAHEWFATQYLPANHAFWLDGGAYAQSPSWSYMGSTESDAPLPDAKEVFYYQQKSGADACALGQEQGQEQADFFTLLGQKMSKELNYGDAGPPPFAFHGGYVGYLAYELRSPEQPLPQYGSDLPDAVLLFAQRFLALDHAQARVYAAHIVPLDAREPQHTAALRWIQAQFESLRAWANGPPEVSRPICEQTGAACSAPDTSPAKTQAPQMPPFQAVQDDATYLSQIAQAKEWIAQGQSYQICLTNAFGIDLPLSPWQVYCTLRSQNPAPYAAYIQWAAHEDWPAGALLSASPEQFLHYDPTSRRVQTKPIKGTIRRGYSPEQDAVLAQSLLESQKDRAENVMIVDLLRNDLSRVCETGSVKVDKLFAIETYATVHQMVTTIAGVLRPEVDSTTLLAACFPGGSMTGAPKIHTLRLLEALEQRARGAYSGAMGWLGLDGGLHLSIIIRSILALQKNPCKTEPHYAFRFGVGGGIVADSDPAAELAEMKLKAQGSMRAIVNAYASVLGEAKESKAASVIAKE